MSRLGVELDLLRNRNLSGKHVDEAPLPRLMKFQYRWDHLTDVLP